MKIFKRKKNPDSELPAFITWLLVWAHQKMLNCAAYLQQKTNRYSMRTRSIILVVFCTVFVSASIIMVFKSLQRKTPAYTIEAIQFIPLKDNALLPVFRGDELRKILRFKHYLDSNKIFRDSLLAGRPHLVDSINLIEKMYQK